MDNLIGSWFALATWQWGWKLGAFLFAWLVIGFLFGYAFGQCACTEDPDA